MVCTGHTCYREGSAARSHAFEGWQSAAPPLSSQQGQQDGASAKHEACTTHFVLQSLSLLQLVNEVRQGTDLLLQMLLPGQAIWTKYVEGLLLLSARRCCC